MNFKLVSFHDLLVVLVVTLTMTLLIVIIIITAKRVLFSITQMIKLIPHTLRNATKRSFFIYHKHAITPVEKNTNSIIIYWS